MRSAWLDHVRATKKKGNRGKKTMSHKEAMAAASSTWPKEKKKAERRLKRQMALEKTVPDSDRHGTEKPLE